MRTENGADRESFNPTLRPFRFFLEALGRGLKTSLEYLSKPNPDAANRHYREVVEHQVGLERRRQ